MGGLGADFRRAGGIGVRDLLRRFWHEKKGAAAVEFALLALPFFLLVFAILESCVAFVAQEMLTNAADDVGRKFRTGQLQVGTANEQIVRDLMCERMSMLFPADCPGLQIDLQHFGTFEDAAEVFEGPLLPNTYLFDPGDAGEKNVLRVYYFWPVLTNFMHDRMANLPDGKMLLFATHTWQNEPSASAAQ
ncbi:TadE/TadG family type IV pilus assembly protein [Chelativorans sp. J32]|uniref:TadE/TadG family type IV pilus assembly protein n=1 Tax=Chelativorans sp. J32 TaxID=935840 RepID=UPI0004833E11|nr:TadE/TadG family type IV pilus assembly protein [Chelativorans sp. J32]